MADLNRINIADVDISKSLLRDYGGVLLATGDELANRFGANVFRQGVPVDMTGCTVRGYFIRANDDTVVIEGVAEGNTVYVDLPAACYAEAGIYSLAIKASGVEGEGDDAKSTIRIVHGHVKLTSTDNIADPDDVFSIAEILAAVDRAEEAAERAEEAARNAGSGGGGTGGGGIVTETDPTVPAWAKAASKPTYSKSEVGLGNVDNVKQYSSSNPPPYPVKSVAGKTGAVTLGKLTIAGAASGSYDGSGNVTINIPTVAGEPGQDGQDGADGQRGTGILKVKTQPESKTVNINGETSVKRMSLSTIRTEAGVDEVIVGDMISYSYYLYQIYAIDATYAYTRSGTSIRGAAGSAGNPGANGYTPVKGVDYFDGAPGAPGDDGYTPVKGVDYYTDADKAEIEAYIAQELAKRGQVEPEYANSTDECTDTSKLYVLPDGYIYAYMPSKGPSYTNLSETVHENFRMNSSGVLSSLTGAVTTDFIPVRKGQTVRFKGFNPLTMPESKFPYICFYTAANESAKVTSGTVWGRLDNLHGANYLPETDGVYAYEAFVSGNFDSANGLAGQHEMADSITHIRLCGTMIDGETVIVTVDEEITESGGDGYAWQSTGHAFVPADYEGRIIALERHAEAIPESRIKAIEDALEEPAEAAYSGNILFGKKWVACGDSFTAGGYNTSDGFDKSVYTYQDGRFAGKNIVYPYVIGLRNNMNIVNLATGGQTMADSSNSFMTRYATIPADADYITIMLGINDKVQGLTVGAVDDTSTSTFCGAFNTAMEHILTNHPFAHIGIMVSHGTNAEIMAATRGIAERWGVPYLDYGSPHVPLMNRYTGRNVCAKAQEIRERNFCVASDGTTPTNSHPNTAAHEYESTFIEAWLRTL